MTAEIAKVTIEYNPEDQDYSVCVDGGLYKVCRTLENADRWAAFLTRTFAADIPTVDSDTVDGISSETVAQAVAVAQSKAPHLAAKIDTAYHNLRKFSWQFENGELRIDSAHGNGRYWTQANTCTCKATKICWHRIARRLLLLANEFGQPGSSMPRLY